MNQLFVNFQLIQCCFSIIDPNNVKCRLAAMGNSSSSHSTDPSNHSPVVSGNEPDDRRAKQQKVSQLEGSKVNRIVTQQHVSPTRSPARELRANSTSSTFDAGSSSIDVCPPPSRSLALASTPSSKVCHQ